jgi:cobalt-zinc-cadmium efflux system membrane fusion protein
LAVIGGGLAASTWPRNDKAAALNSERPPQPLRLVSGTISTLELSSHLVNALGMRTVQVQSAANHERLTLSGKLSFDPDRFVRVHSRFPGEVISIAHVESGHPAEGNRESRSLRVGDRVTKGQLLAVVSSKDIGEKKSDLVDALSSFYVHEAQLAKLVPLEGEVIAGKQVREAERLKEADVIQIDRIERTLRSWRVTEAEIDAVRNEAVKIHRGDKGADMAADKGWAKVEVRCPFDGTVLETNAVPGVMVDTSLDLFKIADLSVLAVMANVYEEDLRSLDSLKPAQRRWTIALNSQPNAPGILGQFDRIGNTVDPSLHTAMIRGWLDNQDGRLVAGQSISATVELPATTDEVVIPDTALVQDGGQCLVFVADNETGTAVTRRNVAVVSRGQDVAYIRSQPTPEDQAHGCESLEPGEWVVTAGSVELAGALDSALATTPQRESVKN